MFVCVCVWTRLLAAEMAMIECKKQNKQTDRCYKLGKFTPGLHATQHTVLLRMLSPLTSADAG